MALPITALRPAETDWVPVDACTLPTFQRPLRVAEFDDLFAASLTAVERAPGTGTRARLLLAGDQALPERVQRLAAAETACCSFFAFTITPLPDDDGGATRSVALDVVVPAAHADVLAALVTRAELARGAAA